MERGFAIGDFLGFFIVLVGFSWVFGFLGDFWSFWVLLGRPFGNYFFSFFWGFSSKSKGGESGEWGEGVVFGLWEGCFVWLE